MVSLPAGLPSVDRARLPVAYEAARKALSTCSSIDECADWANKSEALASYAKQANDDELRKFAIRIQARAIRRCGELLKAIEPGNGKRTDLGRETTRGSVARDAGLSDHQRKQALRVASVPTDDFEAQTASASPPTVTKLAEQGTKSRPIVDLGGIAPAEFARATEAGGTLKRFADFCARNDPRVIARAFRPSEVKELRRCVGVVDAWLDAFITNLPE